MSIAGTRVSVGTSATVLHAHPLTNPILPNDPSTVGDTPTNSLGLKNMTATASIFLGGSDVTTANGFEWAVADGPLSIGVEPSETLYGIVASGTQTVHVLKAGR